MRRYTKFALLLFLAGIIFSLFIFFALNRKVINDGEKVETEITKSTSNTLNLSETVQENSNQFKANQDQSILSTASDTKDVLDMFSSIDFKLNPKDAIQAIGIQGYSSGRGSIQIEAKKNKYSQFFELDEDYLLANVKGKSMLYCHGDTRNNLDVNGEIYYGLWKANEDSVNYDLFLALKEYLTDRMGQPTNEGTSENNLGETYSYSVYWGRYILSYDDYSKDGLGEAIYLYCYEAPTRLSYHTP